MERLYYFAYKKKYSSIKTIIHCTCIVFMFCEINYLVYVHCDQMIHYCIDENYYHVTDRLMGIITKSSTIFCFQICSALRGARWLSGRVSDSGARGPGFETYRRRVVSLSKTLYSLKVLVNYPGSDGSVPT